MSRQVRAITANVKVMKLYLKRECFRQHTTDGTLSTKSSHICDTIEHTQMMLPEGLYKVQLKNHPRLHHRAPKISLIAENSTNVKSPTAFIIHGNGVYGKQFGSSIAVGERIIPGVVIKSRFHFENLVHRIEMAIRRGGEVVLEIK